MKNPWKNQVVAQRERKNDSANGMNSTLLVLITCLYKDIQKINKNSCLFIIKIEFQS